MILIFFGTTENPKTNLNGAGESHCIYAKGEGVGGQAEAIQCILLVSLFGLRDTHTLC